MNKNEEYDFEVPLIHPNLDPRRSSFPFESIEHLSYPSFPSFPDVYRLVVDSPRQIRYREMGRTTHSGRSSMAVLGRLCWQLWSQLRGTKQYIELPWIVNGTGPGSLDAIYMATVQLAG